MIRRQTAWMCESKKPGTVILVVYWTGGDCEVVSTLFAGVNGGATFHCFLEPGSEYRTACYGFAAWQIVRLFR
jgi:hypothetical protein